MSHRFRYFLTFSVTFVLLSGFGIRFSNAQVEVTAEQRQAILEQLANQRGNVQGFQPVKEPGNVIFEGVCGDGKLQRPEECETALLAEDYKQYCNSNCEWNFPEDTKLCVEEEFENCAESEKELLDQIYQEKREQGLTDEENAALRQELKQEYIDAREQCLERAIDTCQPEEEITPPENEAAPAAPKLPEQVIPSTPTVAFAGSGCSLQAVGGAGIFNGLTWLLLGALPWLLRRRG